MTDRKRKQDEAKLQCVVCQYLDAVLPSDATYWAVFNEADVSKTAGAWMNKRGRKAGVADLHILHAGKPIYIEMKTERNPVYGTVRTNQTEAQKLWQDTVERCGGVYAVCRSTDDVRDLLMRCDVPIREVA